MAGTSNEAVVVLNAHIKGLEKQKAALEQKFKRCHTEEFLDEMSKLRSETLSLDAYKKRQNFVKKKLAQMEKEFAYWTPETIEKNCNEIGAIDLKIEQCERAIMFVPKWP